MNKILIVAAIVAVLASAAFAQCNSQSATNCANDYNSCVLSAGTNINAICACYGPYFSCLRNINCLTDSEYNTIKQTCSTSGCTAAQCSSAVSISGVFGLFVAAVAAFF